MPENIAKLDQEIRSTKNRDEKYLTFTLGKEAYGIAILKVREIIGMVEITEMPNMPAFVKGVINLRGKVSPVIDLRTKFSMPPADYTSRTCIVLVDIRRGDNSSLVGMVVDSVSEVMNISADNIEPPPNMGGVSSDFIQGIAKKESKVIMLLNIDRVMNADEIIALEGAT